MQCYFQQYSYTQICTVIDHVKQKAEDHYWEHYMRQWWRNSLLMWEKALMIHLPVLMWSNLYLFFSPVLIGTNKLHEIS